MPPWSILKEGMQRELLARCLHLRKGAVTQPWLVFDFLGYRRVQRSEWHGKQPGDANS